ncbi:hypothetical protein D3C78_1826940 [compost metagenome]
MFGSSAVKMLISRCMMRVTVVTKLMLKAPVLKEEPSSTPGLDLFGPKVSTGTYNFLVFVKGSVLSCAANRPSVY